MNKKAIEKAILIIVLVVGLIALGLSLWSLRVSSPTGLVSLQPPQCGDNCPYIYNPDQADADQDGFGDACDPCTTTGPEFCTGDIDEDCDGLIDCSDPDCAADPACLSCTPENCTDGQDNDCDGLIDCDDSDCAQDPACCVPSEEICDNLDNDCDSQIDEGCDDDDDDYCDANISFVISDTCPNGDADCNDENENINPGMVEVCNKIDDNCNGQIDEGLNCGGGGGGGGGGGSYAESTCDTSRKEGNIERTYHCRTGAQVRESCCSNPERHLKGQRRTDDPCICVIESETIIQTPEEFFARMLPEKVPAPPAPAEVPPPAPEELPPPPELPSLAGKEQARVGRAIQGAAHEEAKPSKTGLLVLLLILAMLCVMAYLFKDKLSLLFVPPKKKQKKKPHKKKASPGIVQIVEREGREKVVMPRKTELKDLNGSSLNDSSKGFP